MALQRAWSLNMMGIKSTFLPAAHWTPHCEAYSKKTPNSQTMYTAANIILLLTLNNDNYIKLWSIQNSLDFHHVGTLVFGLNKCLSYVQTLVFIMGFPSKNPIINYSSEWYWPTRPLLKAKKDVLLRPSHYSPSEIHHRTYLHAHEIYMWKYT